ncbi:MAG TPA: hypothetical protein VM865_00035 [Acidobacteriaceae bacterium]|jgi:hypothetical protein|nr:hypothetical protein [Acidobacteriaceae bacterium]
MRFKLILCGAALTPALLLTGCGVGTTASFAPEMTSPGISGRSFGGQQPVVGATISVVGVGTSGYGSRGTILASTQTDSSGNFSFAPGAYSCPQTDTPVYLLGIGGDAGSGNNPSAVLAAGLGTCTAAKNSFVVLNEVTTAAVATALAHFFSPTLGGSNAANDWFGGPSVTAGGVVNYSRGLVLGNSYTIPAMVSNAVGAPNQAHDGYAVDTNKINTIANVLAACVNSSGSTSTTETKTTCGKLFRYTTPPSGTTRPSDTLQAAVQMALYPDQNVTNIFSLITTQAPFAGMAAAPNDWTIGISYTSSGLGLAVNTGTVSTLDIDNAGKVWFPSNASGQTGAAYFDPKSQTFNGPFNSTGLVHPQQVAIDGNGFAWFNDSGASSVSGYLYTAPTTTHSLTLANTVSNTVTVDNANRVNFGTVNGGTNGLARVSIDYSTYTPVSGVTFPLPTSSVTGDAVGGVAETLVNAATSQMRSYYVSPANAVTDVVNANDNSGQVIFTGNDFVSVRSYSGAGNANDGLCIYSAQACYNFRGGLTNRAQGIAIDGASNLWIAESGNAAILNVPVNNPGGSGGAVYLNSNGVLNILFHEYPHGSANGGTLATPYGIGIDNEGNVWVSNAGCTVTSCAPGSFTLTEIVGAATPTITPVSYQITTDANLVGTEPAY